MNIKSRIKKISQALEKQIADEAGAFLTLEQYKRRADGEDITKEIPINRRAEFDELECRADERVKEAERIYRSHSPELAGSL